MKIFRKIRQGLIEKGDPKKYLLYAIGEILIVMIGILFALQVNNWNTTRIEKQSERKSYQNIKRQLNDDIQAIDEVKGMNSYHTSLFEHANQIINSKDQSRIDTLAFITMGLSQYSDFHRSGNIYETLVNSGEIRILKNSEILSRLQNLEMTYMQVNKLEDIHWAIIMEEFSPEIRGAFNYSTFEIVKPKKLYSVEIQNIFVECIYLTKAKDVVYNKALSEMKSIIELIDEEIQPYED